MSTSGSLSEKTLMVLAERAELLNVGKGTYSWVGGRWELDKGKKKDLMVNFVSIGWELC